MALLRIRYSRDSKRFYPDHLPTRVTITRLQPPSLPLPLPTVVTFIGSKTLFMYMWAVQKSAVSNSVKVYKE